MAKAARLAAARPDNRWRTLSPLSRQSRRIKLPPRSLAKPRKRQQVPSQECDTELEYSAAERVAQATLKTSVPHALFQIEPRAKADDSE